MKLNAKLVLIMISLLILAMITLFMLNQYTQNILVEEIQASSQEISKAIQLSIDDFTSDTEHSKLDAFLSRPNKKSIKEINIINTDGEIIDSSDPGKIGKKKDLKKLEKGVRKAPQPDYGGVALTPKTYEVLVPVIVGDEQLGYVQINMLLDNIRDIQRGNFIKRLMATSMVFTVGIALIIYLARKYTDPIHRLVQDFKKVSAGDLSVTIPVESKDEIGELAQGFNDMVEKLREREVLEKRLYQAEHLSRVGQLASGIAHEIRNPLNYISLAVDHLKNEVIASCPEKRDNVSALTEKIREEVRRANYMVLNFMNYGRPLKLRRSEISFNELMDKTLSVLEERLSEQKVKVVQEVSPEFPLLKVDPELMRNAVTNFITNAAQAMPGGGTITVGAAQDQQPDWVRISFSDTGKGISEADIEKIFQPYFTTKDVGIGLGLAITERIVEAHGGKIEVKSRPGEGSVFTVRLPMGEVDI